MIITLPLIIPFIIIGCGEPPEKRANKTLINVHAEHIKKEKLKNTDFVKQIAIDMKQTRDDSDCIRSFIADQSHAPKDWKQPSFEDYEKNGCKEIYASSREPAK